MVISFITGYSISYFTHDYKVQNNTYYLKLIDDSQAYNQNIRNKLFDSISSENIRNYLKHLASIPHLAGTPGGKISADYVYDQWIQQGMDKVEIIDYDVLLDFPDENKFNRYFYLTKAESSLTILKANFFKVSK